MIMSTFERWEQIWNKLKYPDNDIISVMTINTHLHDIRNNIRRSIELADQPIYHRFAKYRTDV